MRVQTILKSTVPALTKVRLGAVPAGSPHVLGQESEGIEPIQEKLSDEFAGEGPKQGAPAGDQAEQAALELREEEALSEAIQRGYQDGFSQGHADGKDMGKQAWDEQITRLTRQLQRIEQEHLAALEQRDAEVFDLTFEAVCRILGQHALDADVVAGVVCQVLRPLREQPVVRIHLHPAEMEALQNRDGEPSEVDHLQPVRHLMQADASMEYGGCRVETARGTFEGGFDVQLRRLKTALEELRASEGRGRDGERPAVA